MASLLLAYRIWDGIYQECEWCANGERWHQKVLIKDEAGEVLATGVWNWDLRIMCAVEPVS